MLEGTSPEVQVLLWFPEPTQAILTSPRNASELLQLVFVASLSLIFYIIAVLIKC